MGMDTKKVAQTLTKDLDLDVPPIQISFLTEVPSEMKKYDRNVPSWCTFWAEARKESFYAPLDDHMSCEIGAFVLGAPLGGAVGEKLTMTLSWMQQQGYLEKGEEAHIPHLDAPPKFVAYGPLGQVPSAPSAVVLFARPSSAMVAMEAASPGQAHPFGVGFSGRSACAVIPTVLQGKAPFAVSLGCGGFRTFVEPGNDKMLIAVRGDYVEEFSHSVHRLQGANLEVGAEMARRKAAVPLRTFQH